ncbi:MAG: D-glycero-beta-D-manno-heptose 1,7-bisphosphate 7-phosphatase [Halieaceae bacterium]|jgi:D-glycero-D-manno-heptose 1,7-bisphosphate phosphatase|nr:D-glycero-beta-D-manno-heptose 1,7-bisphosphate 7-phosphatase [Gammaproteobacteria bacterium]MBT4520611.1 D-glycero-beta-D-manno-heptose 1,7-bisphosphate 7-phosphatase [Halieaceae bacterium]
MALLILDRDGVINQDSASYIRSLEDWIPIPGSIEAIAALSQVGFTIAIATNQSGLSRGYFTIDDLEAIHSTMVRLVEEQGGHIAGVFYCPHHPDEGCECRKPGTGLLSAIEQELGESATDAFFIGDSLKDLQAAQTYGCKPVLVKTGNGISTLQGLQANPTELINADQILVYNNLAEAADAIVMAGSRFL